MSATKPEAQEINWSAVLEKLEKTQRLIDGAATQGEAEAASAAFTRLLNKYDLTAAEYEQKTSGRHAAKTADDFKAKYPKQEFDLGNGATWRQLLFNQIAINHNCRTLNYGRGSGYAKMAVIIGRPDNVDVVKRLYAKISKAIERLAKEWAKGEKETIDVRARDQWWLNPQRELRQQTDGFRIGAVDGFTAAMREAKRAEEAEHEKGLVLVISEELKNAINAWYPPSSLGRHGRRSYSYHYGSGYNAGKEAGRGLNAGNRIGG